MRVLQIGQLPKEMGGNYTTGVARVVGELSKNKFGSHITFLYATNISNEKAKLLCTYKNRYMGYVKRPLHLLLHMLMHPKLTMEAYNTYRITDNASFLHMEFIRDNFSRIISMVKPDVIHHHGTALSALYYANYKNRIPVIYTPHGIMLIDNQNTNIKYQHRLKATKLTLSFANHITALNESVVKRLINIGVDRNKVSVVPNGVDTRKFYYSEEARKEVRNIFGVNDNTIVFITVGLVIDRKGQFVFLKLLESLGIDYQYWIIGKGPDEMIIHNYIAENDISDKVRLLGYLEDKEIFKYHSAADIYALTSLEEAQSLAEIEAYTCGLRIIVNKVISDTVIGDVEKDKENYYVVDFNNICKNDFIAWMHISSGERVSRNQFDWQVIADAYARVYEISCKR